MRRASSILMAVAMLLPGPTWAQQVVASAVGAPSAVPVVPVSMAAPSLSGMSLGAQGLGLAPTLAPLSAPAAIAVSRVAPAASAVSPSAPAATAVSQATPLRPLSSPVSPSAPAATAVSQAAPLKSLHGSVSPAALAAASPAVSLPGSLLKSAPLTQAAPAAAPARSVQTHGTRVRAAAQALGGEAEAGRAMPSLSHLGSEVQGPKADAGAAELRAQAEEAFAQKAAFAASIQAGGEVEAAAAGAISTGRSRRVSKKDDEGQLQPSKYKARDIPFNRKTFPSVAFRPDRPIEPLIVQAINASKTSISIAMYEFKSKAILKALREARRRGVKIQIVVDYTNVFPKPYPDTDYIPSRSMELQSLINEGFDLLVLRGLWQYGIMHNKFMVFDGKMAEFGSYNFTYTAENNHYENAKFTDDKKHIGAFQRYFEYLRAAAIPFEKAKHHPWPTKMPAPPADEKLLVEYNGARLPLWVFSPNGGAGGEKHLVDAINAAKRSISISMFTLRSTLVAEALLAAKRRGVDVRVILDKSQFEGEAVKPYGLWLAFNGIPVRILAGPNPDGDFQLAEKDHNKFMVVDEALVETGSMNWTKNAAAMSFENMHFTTDRVDAKAYSAYFEDMYAKAAVLPRPASADPLPTDAELLQELLKEPEPPAPPTQWPQLPQAPPVAFNGVQVPAYVFRPNASIKAELVQAIDASKKSIHIAVYEFTLPEVLDALRRARQRGVDVHVIVDYSHAYPKGLDHAGAPRQRSPEIAALIDEKFDVTVLRGVGSNGIMHNKFAVFDGKLAEFGSYNWAKTAEDDHFESANFTSETGRVDYYLRYWAYMRALATPPSQAEALFGSRAPRPKPPAPPVDDSARIPFNRVDLPRTMGSPGGGIEEVLVAAIGAAKKTIDFAMFSFYSQAVAQALVEARDRGVQVRILLDAGQAKLGKLSPWLAYHDMEVKHLAGPDSDGNVMFQKMHNKFMILDGEVVETGSFNHTPNADLRNFENANFLDLAEIVQGFTAFFQMMYEKGWKARKPAKEPELKPAEAATYASAY